MSIGPAGWSYADWEGVVYPKHKGAGFHALRFLADYVDLVEINSSFYSLPRAEHTHRWIELIANRPSFRFSAKLHQSFTHEVERPLDTLAVDEYRAGIAPLKASGRLLGLLAQFPWTFTRDEVARRRLHELREAFSDHSIVVELRHRSWYSRTALAEIEAMGWSLAWIDLPESETGPPREQPSIGAIGYLRLHGRNRQAWFDRQAGRDQKYDYLYGQSELTPIVDLARRLAGEKDSAAIATNNHFAGKALVNALEIRSAIEAGPVRVPRTLIGAYPRLASIARAEGQGEFFT